MEMEEKTTFFDISNEQFLEGVYRMRRSCSALNYHLVEANEANRSINCCVNCLDYLRKKDDRKHIFSHLNEEMFDLLREVERISMKMMLLSTEFGPMVDDPLLPNALKKIRFECLKY
jgi:hypothetical protein